MKSSYQSFRTTNSICLMIVVFFLIVATHSACHEDKSISQTNVAMGGVVNGIDTLTGLAFDEHFEIVRANCITCHSSKLITQNRATREGWKGMLDWMKETQNLHELGDNEGPILDYLAKHYAPENKGRRANLENVEWYDLTEE